ncbi:MAG TPA: hypothetical protein V6C65_16360 [Allocoleopsis sp.]
MRMEKDRLSNDFAKYCRFCLGRIRSRVLLESRTCLKCSIDPGRRERYQEKLAVLPENIQRAIEGNDP